MTKELTIIIPCLNERDNIRYMVTGLEKVLPGIEWEVLFVDDNSEDGTADLVREIAQTNPRVRCLQRIGRRGLSSACVEGLLASSSPYVCIMDADGQHDESLLPQMLQALQQDDIELAIASRYLRTDGVQQWTKKRIWISKLASLFRVKRIPDKLTDPMSGYFMLKRETFMRVMPNLSSLGFKILYDIFASSKTPIRYKELPYVFRNRHAGTSKLDARSVIDHIMLLADKTIGRIIPIRFLSFVCVGAFGVLVHLFALYLLQTYFKATFAIGQLLATLVAMTSNYYFNNRLTYFDLQLHGWKNMMGYLKFIAICSVGVIGNVSIASLIFEEYQLWYTSAIAGILVSVLWNYAVTNFYIWSDKR